MSRRPFQAGILTLVATVACIVASASATQIFATRSRPMVDGRHSHGSTTVSVLYSFKGPDGAYPTAGILDVRGTLYGTTTWGFLQGKRRSGVFHGNGGVFALTPSGAGYVETTAYGFQGGTTDGSGPNAGVVADKAGALYGTTYYGGKYGSGTVFKLTPSGSGFTESVIYNFGGLAKRDGSFPYAGLVIDSNGALYGTTEQGGVKGAHCSKGCGVVFKLIPSGSSYTEDVLYRFIGGTDAYDPIGSLVEDASGSLFGTAYSGGASNKGAVFALKPSGSSYAESVVYSFGAGANGSHPVAGLLLQKSGTLYGTTFDGGGGKCQGGCGTVFSLTPRASGYAESVVYAFQGGADGYYPYAPLLSDRKGALYGTTLAGGGSGCLQSGCGTIFKMTPKGSGFSESLLYVFQGGSDGAQPKAALIGNGNTLYGTTYGGGSKTCFTDDPGCGTVFKLAP